MRLEKVCLQGSLLLDNAEGERSGEMREGVNSSTEELREGLVGSEAHKS